MTGSSETAAERQDSTADSARGETDDRAAAAVADRVVVSYPDDLSDWGRFQVEKQSFCAFLGRVHDEARVGDVWDEFVGAGCCGKTLDVPLRVERVEGGPRISEDTEFEYEVREACDIEGSWQIQSEDGPRRA